MKIPEYFFVASEGVLYDTRKPKWHENPLRANYARTFRNIENGLQLRASIRAGQWAFPGGYEIFAITSDGAALCMECVKNEYRSILWSIRNRVNDGWRVIGFDCAVNYDDEVACDHCGHIIVEQWDE